MKRILLAVAATSVLVLAGCSNGGGSSTSSGSAADSSSASTSASSPAAGSQTALNPEQIAAGQQLSDSASTLTWFVDVGQTGSCGKFSKTFAECEQKSWDLMLSYIDAQLEQYQGFAATMAPGDCLTQIQAMEKDIATYKTVMTTIHEAAQKQDQKAMQKAAGTLPSPTATNFAAACGVALPSSSASPSAPASPSTSSSGSESPSPAAS